MSFYRKIVQRYPDSYTAQIMALDTHCSNLSSRLISTLDSIDAIRLSHKQEVEDLQHRIHILDARCRMLKHRVKSAEMERDELREGVERLVEKVEIANDYRVLPHASIHLSSPLESVEKHPSQELDHLPDTRPLLSLLLSQLAFAKSNYRQLKHSSDARIALLEAKIARRDLEFQSCRPCTCLASHVPGSQPNKAAGPFGTTVSDDDAKYLFTRIVEAPLNQNILRTFSREEGLKVLEETASYQRVLQTEVASLCEKLDNEKKLISGAITSSERVKSPQVRIPSAVSGSRISTTMETIEQHIHRLNIDAKDMRAEYDNITNFIPSVNKDDEQLKRCFLLEEECIRRRKSEQELRQKLLLASTAEQDLRNLVNKLQEQLRDQNIRNDDDSPSLKDNDTVSITPATVRMNQVQTELEQAQLEVDRRQLVIDELRNQITLLHQQTQNIEDNG